MGTVPLFEGSKLARDAEIGEPRAAPFVVDLDRRRRESGVGEGAAGIEIMSGRRSIP
jgi:hypothetical protein